MNHPKVPITYHQIQSAAQCLNNNAKLTPVFTSTTLNQLTGAEVFLKCENFQRTGSFKFRGALFNALSQLSTQQGVITYSSGNHAQGVARSGQLLQIPTTIVMPNKAPAVKLAATRGYGAQVITYDPKTTSREELAKQLAAEQNLTMIPPYDHPEIIAGQGTVAKELIEQISQLDVLLVCCGGGGLLSGCAIIAKALCPHCQVIGVEPERADDATRSFYSKVLQRCEHPDTIADGARTPSLGQLTFPIILDFVDEMVTVSEEAIRETLTFLWERLKLVVEPTGTLATAALLKGMFTAPGKRVGVIISGGNVDLKQLPQLLGV